jgi:transcriptional regulator with XRE-family HTH domain
VNKSRKRPFQILGENIARLRKERGFSSQSAFAHKLGVGISTLKDIERGVSEGHIDTRQAIADLLKCEVINLYQSANADATPARPGQSDYPDQSMPALLEAKLSETLRDVVHMLEAWPKASELRRLTAMYILTKDEMYVDRLRALGLPNQAALVLRKLA